jgi:YD repeat-containing protein
MKRRLLPALILLAALHGFADGRFFASNDSGMLLKPIEPYLRDQSDWVVEVARDGDVETRRLFEKGREVRRWEATLIKDGSQRVEKEWRDGALAARRVYDARDTLLQEEQYEADVLSQKTLYTYTGGRLTRKRALAADGSTLYAEEYRYAVNGSLREVRRTGQSDDRTLAAYTKGTSGLSEERVSQSDSLSIRRFDARSRVTSRELRSGGTPVLREDFTFRPDSDLLLSSREERPVEGFVTERSYDEQGLLAAETMTGKGAAAQSILYTRDGKGNVVLKSSRGPNGYEVWKYTRDGSGGVAREEYYLRGSLMKVTVNGEGKLRTEELYKGGKLFLKVFYDGDARLREEVYLEGVLLRERSY